MGYVAVCAFVEYRILGCHLMHGNEYHNNVQLINLYENKFCASSGDSELGRVSSGWITSRSLSKFAGS